MIRVISSVTGKFVCSFVCNYAYKSAVRDTSEALFITPLPVVDLFAIPQRKPFTNHCSSKVVFTKSPSQPQETTGLRLTVYVLLKTD